MKKIIIFACTLFILINTTGFADVLGNVSGGYSSDLGLGSFFYKTEFTGGSRGNQTEHYIEYTPNKDITPVVVSGDSLWGSIDMYKANEYIIANGFRSKGAINADFFSFKTGLSMGYTISEGEIVTKVFDRLPAIGFRADGTAFIDELQIKTTVYKGNLSAEIAFINKWYQAGFDPICLLTDYFGKTTKTEANTLFVLGQIKEGSVSLNEDAVFICEEIFEYDGEIEIPKDKAVLVIDIEGGNAESMEFMRSIEVGDELIIKNEAINSEKNLWSEAKEVSSTITPQLIKNGQIGSNFEAGVNPRTAAGITKDGKVILYTLDGRKTGYSAGATLNELAMRMLELGCIDAINFDGGGSTAIGAKLYDLPDFQILNRPSDGYPRKVANYIFLQDNRLPTGIPKEIKYNNLAENIYVGAKQKIVIDSVYDSAEYKITDYKAEIISNDAIVTGDEVTFNKKGTATVLVNIGEYTDTLTFEVYDSVDSFKVFDTSTWKEVEEIILNKGEIYSAQLRVVPYTDEKELLLGEGVKWNINENLGQISGTGYVLINADNATEGNIEIEIGGIKKKIPVNIVGSTFVDIEKHWSKDKVNYLVSKGILNGIETENGLIFLPDKEMTRVEFVAIVVRYLGLNLEDYNDFELLFTDSADIAPWAKNIVKAAVSHGIMNGVTNDGGKTFLFEANNTISRAEAVAVLGRTIDYQSSSGRLYSDDSSIPEWAKKEVYKLSELNILQGYSDNTMKPMNRVTRAEAASMIYNALNFKKDMQ